MELIIKTKRGQCPTDCLFNLDCHLEEAKCPLGILGEWLGEDVETEVITEVTKVP